MAEKTEGRLTVEQIARIVHQAQKAHCEEIGDPLLTDWEEAAEWQRGPCIAAVRRILNLPYITPELHHEMWASNKLHNGWKYGENKDDRAKTHPHLLPWDKLTEKQKNKNRMFIGIVNALRSLADTSGGGSGGAGETYKGGGLTNFSGTVISSMTINHL